MTPQEQLIKLLHSYNPDLPMGEGMKAQFLALRDECDRLPVVSPDANVEKNRQMLLDRSVVGLKKYGVTTERDDLSLGQWVQHAIEEVLDLANYLQALKTNLERAEVTIVRNSAGQIYLQYADGKTLMDYPVGSRFTLLPPEDDQLDLFAEGDS